jgi:DNA primase
VRVTTLPAGKDPDEVALADAQQWAQIVTAAQPIVVHVMETLAASRNLEDPKEKREVANQVMPLIDDVPDPVERDAYRQRLARILKVDERVLVGSRQPSGRRSTLRRPGSKSETSATPQKEVRPAGAGQLALDMEKHCLRLVLQKPDMLYTLDRRLQKAALGRFSADDFATADVSALAALVLTALAQDQLDPPEHIRRNLSASLADLHAELTQPARGNQEPARLLDDLLRTLIQLRLLRIREGVDQLRFLQQDAQQNPDFDLNMYNEMIMHYTQDRNKLELALSIVFLPERA